MDHEQIENLLVIHAEHLTQMREELDAIAEPTLHTLLPETDQRIQDLDTRLDFLNTGFHDLASQVVNLKAQVSGRQPEAPFSSRPLIEPDPSEDTNPPPKPANEPETRTPVKEHEIFQNHLDRHTERLMRLEATIKQMTHPTLLALQPETDQRIQDLDTRIGFLETGFKEAIHRQHDVTMRPLKTLHDSIDALNSHHVTRLDRLNSQLEELKADVELRHPPTPQEDDTGFPGPNFPH